MRVCETFRSLQGEGLMIGVPTFFIRTVGCNLACSWCDTGYAAEEGEEMSVESILSLVDGSPSICVTGGEPLLQEDMPELIGALLETGRTVVLETNGSLDVSRVPNGDNLIISMDIKCPSSGMSDRMMVSNLEHLSGKDQLKFVIGSEEDLESAARFLRDHSVPCPVILSPVGGMDLLPLAEGVLSRGMNARVLPQLHKIIWGDKRSV